MTALRVYLAGRMGDQPHYNYPLFNRVAATLRESGWDIANPAETDKGSTHHPRAYYLKEAYRLLTSCDAIAMLPGWDKPPFSCAQREYGIAQDLGLSIYDVILEPFCSLQLHQKKRSWYVLGNDAESRKACPVATGVLDYFPDALVAVSRLSQIGNDQHNPGEPLHWDRSKSGDESDALMRHFLKRGQSDADGVPHSVKVAWRALALLQKEIEANGD